MLVGHHAVGFAAKRVAPGVSLGTLQLASVFLDLIVFVDQLAGIEHARVTPGITAFSALDGYDVAISHSLVTAILWSAGFAMAYFWWGRRLRASVVLFAVVFSHWVLDWVSHRPEIPLAPGVDRYVGLGLWNSIAATFVVEGALWVLGIVIYLRMTKANSRFGRYSLPIFIGVLTLAWVWTPFGSMPAGDFSRAALLTLLAIYAILLALAYWIEHYRTIQPEMLNTLSRQTVGI
jgi:hypothetical protein